MKKLSKLFMLLVAVLGLVGLVACGVGGTNTPDPKPEPVLPYNALGAFEDGGDEVYTVLTNTEEELAFSYEKASEALSWAYIYTYVDANAKLENYKKLVLTAHGTGTMLVKLECIDGTESKEVSINIQANATTYDWNLMNDAEYLKSVVRITIFAAPGKAEGVGEIHITNLSFEETVAGQTGNFIINTGYNDIPTNVNEYNGKDENFDFNAKWSNVNDECYEIEQDEETKEVKVKYNKTAGMEWSCMASNVKGNFAKFKYVVLVIKGTEGNSVLLKAEGQGVAKEVNHTFDGSVETLVLDISTYTAELKSAIAKIVLFGHPGGEGKGNFTIYQAYMSETSPIEVEETIVNEYDGVSETFDISKHWYDGGDGVYTVTKSDAGVVVDYAKTAEWQFVRAYVRNVSEAFNYVVVEVTGTAGNTIMLKAANGVEKTFTLTGDLDQCVLDISGIENKGQLSEFIIFAQPGSKASGQFVIENAYYAVEVEGVEAPTVNEYTEYQEQFDINKYWADNNTGTYTVEENIISWNKPAGTEWTTFKTEIVGLTNEFKYLYLVVKGTEGQQILVKPNDNGAYEQWITLSAEEKGYYIAVPEELKVVHIFGAAGQANVEGEVEIVTATLVRSVKVAEDATSVNLMDALFATADPVYTISDNTIAYEKGAYSWAFAKATLVGATEGFTSIRLTIKGQAGLQLLVKPNDHWEYETWIDLTGEVQTIVLDKVPASLDSFLIFVAPGVENISGTIEVTEMVAEKGIQVDGEKLTVAYEDKSDNGFYTITEGAAGVVVDYNITMGGWFYFLMTPTQGVVENVEKLSLVIEGNVQILIKPNDNGALEKWVTLEGEQLVEVVINGNLEKILIFVNPNNVCEGTLTIKTVNHKVNAPTENVYVNGTTFDVNHFWASGDAGEYTFTEEGTKTVVEYHTTGGWKFFSNPIKGVTNQFNHLKVTLVSDKDVLVTLKPADNGAYERHINLVAGQQVTYYLAIPENMTKIVGFIAGDQNGATGTVEFVEMTLVNVYDSNSEFAQGFKDCGDGVYTVTPNENGAVVNYNKTGQEWAAMYVDLIPVTTADHELKLVVTGTAGVQILVKLNNSIETWYTMTGAADTFVVENVPAVLNQVHIFIAGGVAVASGSIQLSIVTNEKEIDTTPVTFTLVDNGQNAYVVSGDINEGNVIVSYAKNDGYNALRLTPSKAIQVTAIRVVVAGSDVQLIVKPNDNWQLETNKVITAEDTVFEWTFDEPTDLTTVLFMVCPGEVDVQGQFQIISFEVTLA